MSRKQRPFRSSKQSGHSLFACGLNFNRPVVSLSILLLILLALSPNLLAASKKHSENPAPLTTNAIDANLQSAEKPPEESPEEYWYQVELLIFAYVNTGQENNELWPNVMRPDFAPKQSAYWLAMHYVNNPPSVELSTESEDSQDTPAEDPFYSELPLFQDEPKDFKSKMQTLAAKHQRRMLNPQDKNISELSNILMKMRINGHYRTLKHLIWQQNILEEKDNDFIYVRGGDLYNLGAPNVDAPSSETGVAKTRAQKRNLEQPHLEQSKDTFLNTADSQNLPASISKRELEGSIKIYLSRFLHVETDLWLSQYLPLNFGQCFSTLDSDFTDLRDQDLRSKPIYSGVELLTETTSESTGQAPVFFESQSIQLKQSRKLKNNELHYLDHPLFGILVKFTPIESPNKLVDDLSTEQSSDTL